MAMDTCFVLARREVDDGVHRHVVAGVQSHPEVAGVVGLSPRDRAGRRREPNDIGKYR
jgi:4-hydroxy-3-methylbut-2-enyl diphosphate reductase IspH